MPLTSVAAVEINDSPTPRTEHTKTTNTRKNITLSQIRPFLEIAIPFFKTDRTAFCSLVGVVVLTLIESALNIAFSYVRSCVCLIHKIECVMRIVYTIFASVILYVS
jgi:hypothetical protein